jgi:hypothetical protein
MTLDNQEKFIFGIVMVPDEFAFKLYQFDIGIVQLPNNFRLPFFIIERKFLSKVYFIHLVMTPESIRKLKTGKVDLVRLAQK